MIDIVVERQWPQPLSDAHMEAMRSLAGSCLGIHRVTWCGSLLSADGMDTLCHFRAPDAESVRIAMRRAGTQAQGVWPCRVQDAPDVDAGALARVKAVVVHAFDEPAQFGARELLEVVDMGCFRLHRVRLLRSFLYAGGLRMACLYDAPDAESIRVAQRHAGLPPDRVWAARRFAP